MKPVTTYAQWMLTRHAERYTAAVEALPEDALTWRPADETTNSVAQLVRHVYEGLPWLLGFATNDTEPVTDREMMLQRHLHSLRNDPATQTELVGIIQAAVAETNDLLAKIDGMDLSEEISPMGSPRQRFFFVGFAVDHCAEHLGHAELTKQLWEQRDQTI